MNEDAVEDENSSVTRGVRKRRYLTSEEEEESKVFNFL